MRKGRRHTHRGRVIKTQHAARQHQEDKTSCTLPAVTGSHLSALCSRISKHELYYLMEHLSIITLRCSSAFLEEVSKNNTSQGTVFIETNTLNYSQTKRNYFILD